jgi:class 3 adenylate cyclase
VDTDGAGEYTQFAMQTSNLAIVFTDIKGFTERTGRQSYEENQRMLHLHEALLVPVFRAFEGRLVKTIGDAFMVVFHSPTKAVLSGIAIQDRLWDYNRSVPPTEQIHVRVAVNLGEVREEKGDVFGEPVNITARVEGIAEAGEVLFTEAVYLAMNKAEVPAEDRGVHELKGIAHPVRVYRVPQGHYRLEADGAGGAAVAEPPRNGPPYGGLGLSRAGRLPPVDRAELSRWWSAEGTLRGAANVAGQLVRQGALLGLGRSAIQRLLTFPKQLLLIIAAVVLLVPLLLLWVNRADPVERAVARGDMKEARSLLKNAPASASRTYDEGVIAEAQNSFGAAATHFANAARQGERRGFKRLLKDLSSPQCANRSAAAKALGDLGDRGARLPLRDLAEGHFADEEEEESGLAALFRCNSRKAAREAMQQLDQGS